MKDFGSSWRDGKQFLGVLHSIQPGLIDEEKVKKSSNTENLELAFNLAEQQFGIPQFLEAIDVDVEKPDEKSIMMYVAEIIKVAEARSESTQLIESGNGSRMLSPEMALLDELLLWSSGAEEALKKKHKLRKYTTNDFADYHNFVKELKAKGVDLDRIADHCDPDQIKMIKKSFDSIQKSTDRWQQGKDQGWI